jgi:hypothetical protein
MPWRALRFRNASARLISSIERGRSSAFIRKGYALASVIRKARPTMPADIWTTGERGVLAAASFPDGMAGYRVARFKNWHKPEWPPRPLTR